MTYKRTLNENDRTSEQIMKKKGKQMKPYIVCSGENGRAVVYGYCERQPVAGEEVILTKARMVLYWSKACSGLLGLAAKGPRDGTRLTHAVARVGDGTCKQWLEVSPEAAVAFDEWPAHVG